MIFKDGSGAIDAKEIKAIFKGQSEDQNISNKLWKQLVKEADISDD